jgi:hypothetical protein
MKDIFIHIGYHKTATTWLQEKVFDKHPEIMYLGKSPKYPDYKVIDIFHSLYEDSDIKFSAEENKKRWESIISKFDTSNKKIYGLSDEGLSGGIDWFGGMSLFVADRIKAVFSDYNIKIIIGIREQCSMLESFYSAYMVRGGTNSLERLIYSPVSTGRFLLDKLYYYQLIEYYFKVFGKEKVFIYLLEEIKEDPDKVVQNLFDFLSIRNSNDIVIDKRAVNIRVSKPGMFMMRFFNKFVYGYFNNNALFSFLTIFVRNISLLIIKSRFIKKIFPKLKIIENYTPYELEQFVMDYRYRHYTDKIVYAIDNLLFLKINKFKFILSKTVRDDIKERYKSSNKYLSQLIGKDLKKYGYYLE